MADEKQDRRSQRTQMTLLHALLQLVESKPYEQITVQDIVERANIGRSTFYAHYQNKDDLLMSGFTHQLDILTRQLALDESGLLTFDTTFMFHHVRGHYEIYRTLMWGETGFRLIIEDGQAAFSKKIEERLAELIPNQHTTTIPMPVLAATLSGVLLVLLKWWLDNKMPNEPEQMNAFFQQLIMSGIQTQLSIG